MTPPTVDAELDHYNLHYLKALQEEIVQKSRSM